MPGREWCTITDCPRSIADGLQLSLIRVPGLVQFSRMAEPSLAEPVWFRAACHGICRRYMDRATGGGNRFTHARHAAAAIGRASGRERACQAVYVCARAGTRPNTHDTRD